MDVDVLRLITATAITMEGSQHRFIVEGRHFAQIVVNGVDPEESEEHREAVENARSVLALFDEEGALPQGTDYPSVTGAISTLVIQARLLLTGEGIRLIGGSLSVCGA